MATCRHFVYARAIMAQERARVKREEPERPPCARCGDPATVQASLAVQRLELHRDAGAHTRSYWQPSFRCETRLEVLLCQVCLRSDFKLNLSVSGTVLTGEDKS